MQTVDGLPSKTKKNYFQISLFLWISFECMYGSWKNQIYFRCLKVVACRGGGKGGRGGAPAPPELSNFFNYIT